jgi:hypothetical protein
LPRPDRKSAPARPAGLVGNQRRQLLRLRIFFAAEVHRRRDPFHQVAVRQAVFQRTQQRLN